MSNPLAYFFVYTLQANPDWVIMFKHELTCIRGVGGETGVPWEITWVRFILLKRRHALAIAELGYVAADCNVSLTLHGEQNHCLSSCQLLQIRHHFSKQIVFHWVMLKLEHTKTHTHKALKKEENCIRWGSMPMAFSLKQPCHRHGHNFTL